MALADIALSNLNACRLEATFQDAINETVDCWKEGRRRGPAKIVITIVLTPNPTDNAFSIGSQLLLTLPARKDQSTGFQQGTKMKVDDGSSNVRQTFLFSQKDFEAPAPAQAPTPHPAPQPVDVEIENADKNTGEIANDNGDDGDDDDDAEF